MLGLQTIYYKSLITVQQAMGYLYLHTSINEITFKFHHCGVADLLIGHE